MLRPVVSGNAGACKQKEEIHEKRGAVRARHAESYIHKLEDRWPRIGRLPIEMRFDLSRLAADASFGGLSAGTEIRNGEFSIRIERTPTRTATGYRRDHEHDQPNCPRGVRMVVRESFSTLEHCEPHS